MPNLQDFFTKSSPSVKDLEPDLLNLTDAERKVILKVMQKDLILKGNPNHEDHEILNEWQMKIKNSEHQKTLKKECECGKRHCHCDQGKVALFTYLI